MVSWLIVGFFVLVLIALLKFKQFRHTQNRIYIVLIILLLLFFYISGSNIINSSKADLKTFNGWITVGKLYFSWLGNAVKNVGGIVGNAIKMDWVGNSTGK